jgi:hypothetical protein
MRGEVFIAPVAPVPADGSIIGGGRCAATHLSRRESLRSLSVRPPVWQLAQ